MESANSVLGYIHDSDWPDNKPKSAEFIQFDGYQRIRALKHLGRDTVEAVV